MRGRWGGGLERGDTRVTAGKRLIMFGCLILLGILKGFGVVWFGGRGA